MAAKANDTIFLQNYCKADPEGRLGIMLKNYADFPKVIHRVEKKAIYMIKAEKEYQRSQRRGELGVLIRNSKKSDPTAGEAFNNVIYEEAFVSGEIDEGFLNGIENSEEYKTIFKTISIMKMDYELLETIIDDLNERESRIIKEHLLEGMLLREIGEKEGRTADAIKKRIEKIKIKIREGIIECLEANCRGRKREA